MTNPDADALSLNWYDNINAIAHFTDNLDRRIGVRSYLPDLGINVSGGPDRSGESPAFSDGVAPLSFGGWFTL